MEPNDPSSILEQQLGPLEFSEPVCWCESTAHYTNPQGQEFELRVRGANSDLVQEYMKEVRTFMEVLPWSEDLDKEEEPPIEQDEKYRYPVEETFKNIKLQPERDLKIDFEIINTQGIKPPYVLKTEIDPKIDGGDTHYYYAKVKAKSIKVNLSASENGVSGYLSGGGLSVRDQADTFSPDPPKNKARFKGDAGNASWFYFSVTGIRDKNKYSVGSSVKLERD